MKRRFVGFAAFGLLSLLAAGAIAAADRKTDGAGGVSPEQVMQRIHQKFSVDCFNNCWTFIAKTNRSPEDVENMILLANASLWHWKQRTDCTPHNLSVGYWQVSRVYAFAGQAELARAFAEKCRKVSEDGKLPPFYIGYAYEALARAALLRKDLDAAADSLAKAEQNLALATDKEEREYLGADLAELRKVIPKKP